MQLRRMKDIMKPIYRHDDDVLHVPFSEAPVVKDVSHGPNVSVGYDAAGQLVEITITDLSCLLPTQPVADETTLVLTERESHRLLELTESTPPRSEHWLAARARYRQILEADEPAIEDDAYAWMTRQVDLLRGGALNDIQRERLAAFFTHHADEQRQAFRALLRHVLIDRWRQDHLAPDDRVIERLIEFPARARDMLKTSTSLREAATADLEVTWHEARKALAYVSVPDGSAAPEPAENCPYTIEQLLVDVVAEHSGGATAPEGDENDWPTGSAHTTSVGGNVFLDLGFPPEEAERLKVESDQRLRGKPI